MTGRPRPPAPTCYAPDVTPLRLRLPEELDPVRGRYVKLMRHAAETGEPERKAATDAGLTLCDALAGREIRSSKTRNVEIRDAGGHGRPFYAGLVGYAQGLAAMLRPGVEPDPARRLDEQRARQWGETMTYCYRAKPGKGGRFAADDGAGLAADVWDDLAQLAWNRAAGRSDPSADAIRRALASQDDRGAFLAFNGAAGDNPEPWWYHELVLLHAVTSYALLTGDADALDAARRAAAFHHAETQPDHATAQPWAVHAFLLDPDTTPTADLLLLAAGVNSAGSLDAVSRILLADAAVCLSLAS